MRWLLCAEEPSKREYSTLSFCKWVISKWNVPRTAEDTLLEILPKVPYFLKNCIFSTQVTNRTGKKYENLDDHFDAIEKTWNEIPDEVLLNIYSSFYARLVVCWEIEWVCLNSPWKRVKKVHGQYRTTLSYYNHPITGQLMVTEIQWKFI